MERETTRHDEDDETGRPAQGGLESPEKDEHPVPGVEHEPEPDAENIMPAKDRPGTL
jgi:hypothetical protein